MAYFLGIDIGGSVIKSGLYDEYGQEKAVVSMSDPTITPHVGWSERNMEGMWQTICASIRKALAQSKIDAHDVRGVSFSAHGKGLYAVNKEGNPVRNGIVSSDNRALPQVRRWKEEGIDKLAYPYAYQQLWACHPVSLLAWLKENEPENYGQIHRILMAHDWIRYKFTGEFGAEITNISGSNLFNPQTGQYDPALFKLFGIEEMQSSTAPVINSSQPLAGITPQAAEETGLKAGTAVFGGFFDVVSAAVCAGLSDEKRINVVMGTWTISTWISNEFQKSERHPYIWGRYCIPETYFVHEGSPTNASNLEWFIRNFMPDNPNPYEHCNQMVASLPKAGTPLQFLPYVFSSNLGDNLAGGLYGLNSTHTQAHIIQAIYEGIAFAQQAHLEHILALSGKDCTLRLTGGPTRSRVWSQMVADLSGLPVEVLKIGESGCLGAAIAAAVGTGTYPDFSSAMQAMCPAGEAIMPDTKAANAYQEKYLAFRQLAKTLDTISL